MKLRNRPKKPQKPQDHSRTKGEDFRLKDYDRQTRVTEDKTSDRDAKARRETLSHFQESVRAGPLALLLIFQAMDAAGKDGAIKHVMSGINPQGCSVTAFKAPSQENSITNSGRAHKAIPTRQDWPFQSVVLRRGSGRART